MGSDSDDSNYIDSETEASLYSQIYHETHLIANVDDKSAVRNASITTNEHLNPMSDTTCDKETGGKSRSVKADVNFNQSFKYINKNLKALLDGERLKNGSISASPASSTKNPTSTQALETESKSLFAWSKRSITSNEHLNTTSLTTCDKETGGKGGSAKADVNLNQSFKYINKNLKTFLDGEQLKNGSISASTASSTKNPTSMLALETESKSSFAWSTSPFTSGTNISSRINLQNIRRGLQDWSTGSKTAAEKKETHKFLSESSHPHNTSLKATIKLLTDEDLKAEKPNRKRPAQSDTVSFPDRKRKVSQMKKLKHSNAPNSTDSSDEAVGNFSDSENQNVVINANLARETLDHDSVAAKDDHPALWQISSEDRAKVVKKNRMMFVECYNCRERGHLSKNCKKPKRVNSCYLCGQPGHKGDACVNPLCSKCLLPGHWQFQCHWSPNMNPPCALCNTKGHLCQECPSIWRRYHLTTLPGPPKTVSDYSYPEKTTCYCYSCGREGHYGYACPRKKKNNVFPMNRVVTDYGDPKRIILHKANVKLWRKRLEVCGVSQKAQQPNTKSPVINKNWKKMQQNKMNKKRKKKKGQMQNKSGVGDIVRINPVQETNFPRSSKKGKKTRGLTVTTWNKKSGRTVLNRTVFHNSFAL